MKNNLFLISNEKFSITVDYKKSILDAWRITVSHVVEHGNLELRNRTFPNAKLGKSEFICRYATLQQSDPLWQMEEIFSRNNIFSADVMQLFAFICKYTKKEVTAKKPLPIVAADPGSRWKCSHEILHEMAGIHWNTWYRNPGPCLHTESQSPLNGFKKGTRFLIIDP